MQAEAVKSGAAAGGNAAARKDPNALRKAVYSRSLSSSAPSNGGADFLLKHYQPNLGGLEETGGVGEGEGDSSDDEDSSARNSGYRPSARAMQTAQRAPDDEDSPVERSMQHAAGIGIGMGKGAHGGASRVSAVQRGDDFSLSKSPTIFSIMSTSQHAPAGAGPLAGMHTADTSTASSASSQSILGGIAAGTDMGGRKRNSLVGHKPPQQHSPDAALGEDDLQFSISLTDEQEGDSEDKNQDYMPQLY
jgi:hypothetical protein